MTRLGIIGCGSHMREKLLKHIHGVPYVEIVGLNSNTKNKYKSFSNEFGDVPHFDNLKEMYEQVSFDKLIVSATPQANEKAYLLCQKNNVPVFLEKPSFLNSNFLDNEKLTSFSKNSAFVGYNIPFSPIVNSFLEKVYELGEHNIREVQIHCAANKPSSPLWGLNSNFEAFVYAVGIHAIDLIRRILASNINVDMSLNTNCHKFENGKFASSTNFQFSNTSIGMISFSNNSTVFELNCRVSFLTGVVLKLKNLFSYEIIFEKSGCIERKEVFNLSNLGNGFSQNGYEQELREFLGNTQKSKSNLTSIFEDFTNLKLARSIIEGIGGD